MLDELETLELDPSLKIIHISNESLKTSPSPSTDMVELGHESNLWYQHIHANQNSMTVPGRKRL